MNSELATYDQVESEVPNGVIMVGLKGKWRYFLFNMELFLLHYTTLHYISKFINCVTHIQ
jgi:hypothetical protein